MQVALKIKQVNVWVFALIVALAEYILGISAMEKKVFCAFGNEIGEWWLE